MGHEVSKRFFFAPPIIYNIRDVTLGKNLGRSPIIVLQPLGLQLLLGELNTNFDYFRMLGNTTIIPSWYYSGITNLILKV
jgi:hypothetical protein